MIFDLHARLVCPHWRVAAAAGAPCSPRGLLPQDGALNVHFSHRLDASDPALRVDARRRGGHVGKHVAPRPMATHASDNEAA